MHECAVFPFISTVQAPQAPSPQPYLLPVKSRHSRNTVNSATSGSTVTSCFSPFTCKTMILIINDIANLRKMELRVAWQWLTAMIMINCQVVNRLRPGKNELIVLPFLIAVTWPGGRHKGLPGYAKMCSHRSTYCAQRSPQIYSHPYP